MKIPTTPTFGTPVVDPTATTSQNTTTDPADITMIEYLHKKAAGTTEAPWKVMKEVKWEIPHPKYHLLRSWPGNYVPARHRDNSCQEEIQATVGSTNNNEALCILEAGLNQIKENVSGH